MHSLNILFVKNCHNELKFKTISFVLFYIELTLIIKYKIATLMFCIHKSGYNILITNTNNRYLKIKIYTKIILP